MQSSVLFVKKNKPSSIEFLKSIEFFKKIMKIKQKVNKKYYTPLNKAFHTCLTDTTVGEFC